MKNSEEIIKKVSATKKYKHLYPPTIERIAADVFARYPAKDTEKEIKRKLHQIWGAYFTRPNFQKLIANIEKKIKNGDKTKEIISPVLKLQTSTNERIDILDDFYQKIFSVTGTPEKIIEPACGLNALTYFWMASRAGNDKKISYFGYDVDRELIDFINKIFEILKTAGSARVELGDILSDEKIAPADLALFLKVLVILERQKKGCSLEILKKSPAKYLAISYPTASLTGKNKGMANFYEKQFLKLIKEEKDWEIEKILFETELVFIVKK